MTKIILAFALTASLLACGGKSNQTTTPQNTTGTTTETQNTTEGTGGTTYGGATYGAPAPEF